MIKTIIFDIGEVITRTNFKAIYSNFAARVGLAPEFVINYHKEKIDDLLLGNITLEKFWSDMRRAGANPKLDLQQIWIEEGIKNREINHQLLNIILKLRNNYSIGVLTNLTHSRKIIDEEMDLYSSFDYAVLSCDEHLQKPDPEFYKIVLRAASAKPEDAIFVDDKAKCIAGAEQVGIKGVVYAWPNNTKLIKNFKQLGVVIEQSLSPFLFDMCGGLHIFEDFVPYNNDKTNKTRQNRSRSGREERGQMARCGRCG